MVALPITQIPTPGLERTVKIAHITDVHIGKFTGEDPGAAALRERMEGIYRAWGRDFENHLEGMLARLAGEGVDAVFATGDLVDFPAPAAIEFARTALKGFPRPVFFISGNHDWNFPYQRPCMNRLRAEQRHLAAPLFLDRADVGCWARDLGGLEILAVDNSTYQIDAEQLAFARASLGKGRPTVLLAHIPITQPALRERTVAFWRQPILMGEQMDAEARRQWNVEADTPETAEFISLLRAAPNLRGIFCGHVHFPHEEPFSPVAAQYVGAPGYEGGIRLFEFQPV